MEAVYCRLLGMVEEKESKRYQGLRGSHLQAWETESPASSINWSIEKAPTDMRSLSSAAAFSALIV